MNDITTAEREDRKPSVGYEPLLKLKSTDLEWVSSLRVIVQEDRETKIRIDAPAHMDMLCSPVQAVVAWTRPAKPGSFRAQLDGKDVTGQFTVDETAMQAGASLEAPGLTAPLLAASVEMFRWLPTPAYRRMQAETQFNVTVPRWELSVPGTIDSNGSPIVDVLPGRVPLRVTVLPTHCTPPALVVTAVTGMTGADEVPGISFETPFTIPKGAAYGFLYVDIEQSVPAGVYWVRLVTVPAPGDQSGAGPIALEFYLDVLPH